VWTEEGELFTLRRGYDGRLGHDEDEFEPRLAEALVGKKVIGVALRRHAVVWTEAGELFTFGSGGVTMKRYRPSTSEIETMRYQQQRPSQTEPWSTTVVKFPLVFSLSSHFTASWFCFDSFCVTSRDKLRDSSLERPRCEETSRRCLQWRRAPCASTAPRETAPCPPGRWHDMMLK
jgi:hypothetical protein